MATEPADDAASTDLLGLQAMHTFDISFSQQPRRRWSAVFCVVGIVLACGNGCSRQSAPAAKQEAPPTETEEDTLKFVIEQFREAKELPHFREALNQASGPLFKQSGKHLAAIDAAVRKEIQALLALDETELNDLDAGTPRALDAAHLEGSFLFRDAARAAECIGLPRNEQAVLGFDWAMRRVLLHEQQDDGLPPHWVLQRGWGSDLDRALVALELLRQWQFDGCLVVVPGKSGSVIRLLGVFLPRDDGIDLALFDPRLGRPIPGPNGVAVATAAQLRENPGFRKFGGLDGIDFARAEARWPWSAACLAPRMKVLEDVLAGPERVDLHVDFTSWLQRCAAVGLRPSPWPAEDHTAPARRARLCYAAEDGGLDKAQRRPFFVSSMLPLTYLQQLFERRHIVTDELREFSQEIRKLYLALFGKYALESRMAVLRGQYETALKRLDLISNALEQADFASSVSDTEWKKQLADWHRHAREAYLAGDVRVQAFWSEDYYLPALLRADAVLLQQRLKRGILSYAVLTTCREPLGNQIEWLRATCWEDKAIRLEAQAAERRHSGRAVRQTDIVSAWRNTRSAWARFLDHGDVAPTLWQARLDALAPLWRQGPAAQARAVGLAEQAHLDLHHAIAARLRQAQANWRLGEKEAALAALKKARSDLTALVELDPNTRWLNEAAARVRAQGGGNLADRVEFLQRDWRPGGNVAALRQSIDDRIAALP
ncbi:MAG: hypothetical protein NZO58_01150 [Gemmataceae bacterium]|nr:hypothetical protein [Gemmataceae bacterium]